MHLSGQSAAGLSSAGGMSTLDAAMAELDMEHYDSEDGEQVFTVVHRA